jgi:hypothetical protein
VKSLAALTLLGGLVLAGCGGHPKPGPPVRLTIDSPSDLAVFHESAVQVSGRVAPRGAAVTVEGRPTPVRGGRFTATVQLEPGTNVVDVLAGRRGSVPAMAAIRVRREVDVRVPELGGATPSDAEDALAGLGLQADVKKAGGVIELLLPQDARVCDTDPEAGSLVAPGTTVTVHVAKLC